MTSKKEREIIKNTNQFNSIIDDLDNKDNVIKNKNQLESLNFKREKKEGKRRKKTVHFNKSIEDISKRGKVIRNQKKINEQIYEDKENVNKQLERINEQKKMIHETISKIEENQKRFDTTVNELGVQSQNIKKKAIKLNINTINGDGSDLIIKRFEHSRPQEDVEYFSKPLNMRKFNEDELASQKNGMAVVIPFFNEPSHELQQTLNSLYTSWEYLQKMSTKWRRKPLHILIVQDGWHKADVSMREYLKVLFPGKIDDTDWWNYYPEFEDYNQERDGNITFVFEKKNYRPIMVNTQSNFDDNRKPMKISLIIKIDNRRKHNSHEWFLGKSGFGEAINAEYLFFTDAFTQFNKTCMYHLVNHMDKNKNVSAATGRQRVMDRDQQGSNESMFSLGYLLRMVQLFDFELANAVYNGAFSLGGFLPVVPGPCGIYRAKDILVDEVRNWYFGIVNEEPDKTGLVLGNLRIAEDRLLSYSSVLKTKGNKSMSFITMAVFYFEAETDLEKFMLQRRRWINGSVAGYLYLLFTSWRHFLGWKTSIVRKFYVWLLLLCQFLIYFAVSIAPAYSMRMLHYSMVYFLQLSGISAVDVGILSAILWGIYISHVMVHRKSKFNYIVIYPLLLLAMVTIILSMAAIIYYAFWASSLSFIDTITNGGFVVYVALFVLFGPFLLALLISGRAHSPILMLRAFIPYMLFINMLIAWFGSYSFARTWDLSWGNRPANELDDLSIEKRKRMQRRFNETSTKFLLFIIALNVGVYFLPKQYQLWILMFFFIPAAFQMVCSIIFLLIKYIDKFKFVAKKCCVCIKKKKKDHDIEIGNEYEVKIM